MRDPKRIERICNKLKELWEKNPDYRFYQMLINEGLLDNQNLLWHKEDNETETHLTTRLKNEHI